MGPISTMGTTATSAEVYAAWDGLLKNNPDAVAVMAPSAQDATAWGLLAKRAGFDLPSGGFDLEAGNLQAVKEGSVDYVMSPEHWLSGYIATKLLADSAKTGEPLPQGLWNVGGLLVSADNVDDDHRPPGEPGVRDGRHGAARRRADRQPRPAPGPLALT